MNAGEEEKNEVSSEAETIYLDKTTSVKARNHKKSERSKPKSQNGASQSTPARAEIMDEEDFKICLYITQKMAESVYAFSFRSPPDPADEDAAAFVQATEKPMDFQTLMSNLNGNVYKSVAEWRKDITLIFENALNYYSPKLMAYESALKLKEKFSKLNNIFTKTEEELWMNKIERICSEYIAAENEQ